MDERISEINTELEKIGKGNENIRSRLKSSQAINSKIGSKRDEYAINLSKLELKNTQMTQIIDNFDDLDKIIGHSSKNFSVCFFEQIEFSDAKNVSKRFSSSCAKAKIEMRWDEMNF